MPIVRDGRNQIDEYRVEPVGSPPGPVVRDRVSEARMADFAAERAAAARPPATPAKPAEAEPKVDGRRARRLARRDAWLQAIRSHGSHAEAAAALGVGKHSIEMFVSDLRRRGELPADVEDLLRSRNPARNPALRPRPVSSNPQGREVSVPATDAADPVASLPAAGEVATPLVSLPEGEDRCPYVYWLATTLVVVCDRLGAHEPELHRGRIVRIGLTDAAVLGHAAVPS